jgi:hypothetical protein
MHEEELPKLVLVVDDDDVTMSVCACCDFATTDSITHLKPSASLLKTSKRKKYCLFPYRQLSEKTCKRQVKTEKNFRHEVELT